MICTIKLTESEVKNILGIASTIDSKAVDLVDSMVKGNIVIDFGGIVLRTKNYNSREYEIELNQHFSKVLLTGPIMDMVVVSKLLKNAFNKLYAETEEHLRAPVTTYFDDDGNAILLDDIDNQYEIYEDEEDYSISETVAASEEQDPPENVSSTEKPRREFAIFNV